MTDQLVSGFTEESDIKPESGLTGSKGGWLYFIFIILSILLPPLGIGLGLTILTTSGDSEADPKVTLRGKSLVGVGIGAFLVQLILVFIFLIPVIKNYITEQINPSNYPGYLRGDDMVRTPYNRQFAPDVALLLWVLNTRNDPETAKGKYENSMKAVDDGSGEPLDWYTPALYLGYWDQYWSPIEDDDARNLEVRRLIEGGMAIKGVKNGSKDILDTVMLIPLMQTWLQEDNLEEADKVYERIKEATSKNLEQNSRIIMEQWAYNSLYEYWQIRDPGKAFDIALSEIRRISWDGETFRGLSFDYEYYGGFSEVFRLSRFLGREDEFIDLLYYLLEVSSSPNEEAPVINARMHILYGEYLGKIGKWDYGAAHLQIAVVRFSEENANLIYAWASSLFNSGFHQLGAENLLRHALKATPVVSMDEFRFLYYDYPAEGVAYIRANISGHKPNPFLAGNLAILAHRAGDDKLADIALRLMMFIETDPDDASITTRAIDAIAAGEYETADGILPKLDTIKPTTRESAYVLAYIKSASLPPVDSATLLADAISRGPYERDPEFPLFRNYFDAMVKADKADDAILFLRDIVEKNPNELYPRYFLAKAMVELENLDGGLAILGEVFSSMGYPGQSQWYDSPMTSSHDATYWVAELNRVDDYTVLLEMAKLFRQTGDEDNFKLYLARASSYGFFDFDVAITNAYEKISQGKLKDAGQILDNLSFNRETDDPDGDGYKQLMKAYANLRAAGIN